jgi:hypothetical protein
LDLLGIQKAIADGRGLIAELGDVVHGILDRLDGVSLTAGDKPVFTLSVPKAKAEPLTR